MSPEKIDQSGATAGNDIIGGNKTEHNYYTSPHSGAVEKLIAQLGKEVENNTQCKDIIDQLKQHYQRHPSDGIDGLEAKLATAGRRHEIEYALRAKEQFSKLLEKWSLYQSAQQIFALLIAQAEYEFNVFVYPTIKEQNAASTNELIKARIVTPLVDQCGASVIRLDHPTALGIVYWIAEKCRIKWH